MVSSYVKSICSPRVKNYSSCYSLDSLKKLVKIYNKNNRKKIKSNQTRKKLRNAIDNNLKKSYCKNENESCWLEKVPYFKNIDDDELKYFTFKPKMPYSWTKNINEWLSTTDIEKVMEQYEIKHPDFYFIGPVPIDFDKEYALGKCIDDELCKISLREMIKDKIKKLGIIFNLDPHDKPGSHWVALYFDLKKMEIYYFDSYGIYPPTEVENLMFRLKEQGKDIKKKINLYYNDIRHQYKNSECGVYSMNFIIEFLDGNSFKKIIENIKNDDLMTKKRSEYYRPRENLLIFKKK